ncbi:hypothetical protein TCAL_06630 [Tigriopus californicus]|uniref:NB-ARC domain-containing protein n=1 Tax=Tigriopus californicus TaxID=6832 RepID=A0A553PLX7_TIGCA|nr:hypothetical protein TCAL_06630 [Tigriopus californicus]|eukprot:TCALIF_06630-PA protein Name:"Similar to RF_0381 Putative ankyrin repeat protein RF_0381 (Rickettsia felis (strain ATCC VR-1525 / URRWXCal2))" AED:0.32 eAED:0.32 QI:0/-1/0/1/-1/1/1/0/1837
MTEDTLETRAKVFSTAFAQGLLEAIRAFYLDATKRQKLKGNLAQNDHQVIKILAKGVGASLGAGAGILCGLFGAFSGVKVGMQMGGTLANMVNDKQNHKVAKQINSIFGAQMSLNEAQGVLKESLSDSALQIFQNFEWQFMVVSTKEGWSLAMERLASEAVYRVIAYLKANHTDFTSDSLFKGVLYGESQGILKQGQYLIGVNGQDWNTDCFFSKPLVFSSPDVSFDESSVSIKFDYGFRLPFQFELNDMEHDPEEYDNVLYEYVIAGMSEEQRNNLKLAIIEELKTTNELIQDLHGDVETLRNDVLAGQEKIQFQLKEMGHENAVQFQEGAKRDEITHNLIRQQQYDLKSILRNVHKNPGGGAIHLGRHWPRLMDVSPSIILSEKAYNSIVSSIHSKLSTDRILVLNGMRGIGKTTACKWFVAHSHDKYEHILWMDSEPTVLETSIKALADKMLISLILNDGSTVKPYSSLLAEVYEQLQLKNCLFIFANVESPIDIKDCLSHEKTHSFIITTKHHNWTVLNGRSVSKLEIGLPSEKETIEYICKETGELKAEARQLAQKLGNLPLAICQSISAIKTLKISISDYLEEFQAEAEKILQQGSTDSVLTTWSLSVKRLKEQYGPDSDLAIQIFNMISFLHSHEIQISLFQALGHRKVEVMKSLDMLMSYALIFWKIKGKSITVHNLIQETNRIQIKRAGETQKYLELAMRGIDCCVQKEYFMSPYSSHLKEVYAFINDDPKLDSMASKLKVFQAIQDGRYKEAQAGQNARLTQAGKNPDDKLTIIKEKASLSKISCYFKEHMSALRGLQECFKSLKDNFGELDRTTLELQLLLGLEELHEFLVKRKNFRAKKTLEGLIPKLINHPDFGITSPLTLLAKFGLGAANLIYGEDLVGCKLLQEFNLERQALSEFKPSLGSTIPKSQDDMREWLSKWYQSLIFWNLSGMDSTQICEFELLGSKQVIITKYLEIFGEHPDLAGLNFFEVLHDIFQMLLPYEDKYHECLEIYEIILDQRQKHLGPHHEQTLMAEAELIMFLALKGKKKDAINMLEKNNITTLMHEDRLNPVILLKDLASVQLEMDIIKKLEIVQGILNKQEESLGPEHNMCKLTLQYMRSLDSSSISAEEYCSLFSCPFAAFDFAVMSNNSSLFRYVLSTFNHKFENSFRFLLNQIASQGNGNHCQYFLEHLKSRCSSNDITAILNNLELVGNPPLVQAILSRRDIEMDRLLISNGANLEFTNNTGWRPLHFAVLREREDVVELLLTKGCQMTTRTNQGNNCLNVAAKKNQGTKVVELVIKKAKETVSLERLGKFINDRNEIGDTPLLTAALYGKLPLVKIFQLNAGDIFAVNNKAWGIMHCAALQSSYEMVEFGLENEMDINAVGSEGRRPIELAASTSNVEFVEFLKRKGADFWTSSSSVLQKSLTNTNNPEVFPFLLKALKLKFENQEDEFQAHVSQRDKDGDTPLMMASYLKKNEFANIMIKQYSVDHQVQNLKGQTVFHWAASSGNLDMIALLNEDLQMRPQEQDFQGHDALSTAINFDQTEFAVRLLDIYTIEDLLIASNDGQTCLHLSCIRFNSQMVEVILKKFHSDNGDDSREQLVQFIHIGDINGFNSLHYAVHGGNSRVQEILICHGADKAYQNWSGLHWAALLDDVDQINKIMEESPSQLEVKTLDLKTPLVIALQLGNISAVTRLSELGSDWTTKSNTHETALHASVRSRKVKVVQLCWNKIQKFAQAKSILDFPSENGTTPFLLAVKLKEVDIMGFLQQQGCNLFARDKSDVGAMGHAMNMTPRVEELTQWLLDHGFKPLETKTNLVTAIFNLSALDTPKKKVRSKTCVLT